MMNLREFLLAVTTGSTIPGSVHVGSLAEVANVDTTSADAAQAWFLLAIAPQRGVGWYEEWFRWPEQVDDVCEKALTAAADSNVYFSSYLFKTPSSTKDNVLPTRTIQADLDDADIITLPLKPSVLVQTSEGRHQGYWFLKEFLDPEAHEVLSRKLTYAIPKCDTSGWPLGRKVRVPYTFNYKYFEGPQQVTIVSEGLKVYEESALELLSDPPAFLATTEDVDFLDSLVDEGSTVDGAIGPQQLLASIKKDIPDTVYLHYNNRQKDRSKALWNLMCSAYRAGLTREEVWWLAWHSANNKFADLQYHAERELAKDVMRAEAFVKSKVLNDREEIASVRKLPGLAHERRQQMLAKIITFMKAAGMFVHTQNEEGWYIRSDLGRPVSISINSQWLNMILDHQFGLNGVEQDKTYVSVGLDNYVRSLPINGKEQALSWYNSDEHYLLVHTGRKDVFHLTAGSISKVPDGSYGVVFPWGISTEPFNPNFTNALPDWGDVLFGSALSNIIGLEYDEAMAILQTWLIFLLFRSSAVSRPILALFGQPGSGKSTLFRRIYALLYGRQRSLSGITTPENFDQAVASNPFVVLDNIDSPEKWLPDRLALSASTSDIEKRRLYTDNDPFVATRQALVGVTAHNPQFSREDVADRLLLLTFKRIDKFIPEGDIIADIIDQRNKLWGGILLDCQRVLGTPLPAYADVPQFRVEDFARTGYWIASALGIAPAFTRGLNIIGKSTKSLNLEADALLVTAIQSMINIRKRPPEFISASKLWQDLMGAPDVDTHAFTRVYRNPVHLSKKMMTLMDSLKQIYSIEWEIDSVKGSKTWRISRLDGTARQNGAGVHAADPVASR